MLVIKFFEYLIHNLSVTNSCYPSEWTQKLKTNALCLVVVYQVLPEKHFSCSSNGAWMEA